MAKLLLFLIKWIILVGMEVITLLVCLVVLKDIMVEARVGLVWETGRFYISLPGGIVMVGLPASGQKTGQ